LKALKSIEIEIDSYMFHILIETFFDSYYMPPFIHDEEEHYFLRL